MNFFVSYLGVKTENELFLIEKMPNGAQIPKFCIYDVEATHDLYFSSNFDMFDALCSLN